MHIGGLAAGRPNAYAVAGTRIDRAKPRQRARGRGFRMTSSRSVNGDANKWLPSVSGLQPRSVPNNRGDRRLARLVEQRFVGDMRAVRGRLDVDLGATRNVGQMLGLDTAWRCCVRRATLTAKTLGR
jgi:hypothetical protein